MYVHPNGVVVYETIEDLLDADIQFVSDCGDNLYVKLKPDNYYDNSIWVVDKKTKKVSFMLFTGYIDYKAQAKPSDRQALERLVG